MKPNRLKLLLVGLFLIVATTLAVARQLAPAWIQQSDILHAVAYEGNLRALKLLLLLGGNANAAAYNYEFGPCPCHPAWVQGDSVVHAALRGSYNNGFNATKILTTLIENGAILKDHESSGSTLFTLAAEGSQSEVIDQLLDRGFDPNVKDSHGRNALQVACFWDYGDIVKELIANGADPNLKNVNGKNALEIALENECSDIAKLLVEFKSNENLIKE